MFPIAGQRLEAIVGRPATQTDEALRWACGCAADYHRRGWSWVPCREHMPAALRDSIMHDDDRCS